MFQHHSADVLLDLQTKLQYNMFAPCMQKPLAKGSRGAVPRRVCSFCMGADSEKPASRGHGSFPRTCSKPLNFGLVSYSPLSHEFFKESKNFNLLLNHLAFFKLVANLWFLSSLPVPKRSFRFFLDLERLGSNNMLQWFTIRKCLGIYWLQGSLCYEWSGQCLSHRCRGAIANYFMWRHPFIDFKCTCMYL